MNTITQCEHQVLKLIAFEYTIEEIASRLLLSHHTIITYRKNLIRKLKVKNTAGLMRRSLVGLTLKEQIFIVQNSQILH